MTQGSPATNRPEFLSGRNNVIFAGVIAVLVIAITLFALTRLAAQTPNSAPNAAEKAVASFYSAVKQQDYVTAYTYLADQQQALLTADSFKLSAQRIDTDDGIVTNYRTLRFDRDTNTANQATIQEEVTRAVKGKYTVALTVTLGSDGTWKILEESGI